MARLGRGIFLISVFVVSEVVVVEQLSAWTGQPTGGAQPTSIAIDYPEDRSVFPPEITAPTFIWRDTAEKATEWLIEVAFTDGSKTVRMESQGEGLKRGEIDPRCMGPTNELPKLTPQQIAAHTWTPDAETWTAIKKHSVEHPATVTITGVAAGNAKRPVSRGQVTILTSKDPVGAPIFYRDVPLMPSESEKGVIKPLAPSAVPLIAWRLRNVGEPRSRLLLTGMHTCANCHSFSRDGKTLGMDLDGPHNDKGLYAIAPIKPQMSISNENVISWNSFPDRPKSQVRVGFMSQVSPDGQYVLTTVNGEEKDILGNYYVVNFKDYRFMQVFYPTRGILAWYNRSTARKQHLPGADDSRYVQTDGVWSPDGKYVVFARAEARDPYPKGQKLAEHANDPGETQVQYDLYRIPFNDGKGGNPEPIAGASRNGMSNTFPKVSPDGRWIVFVQCRNGQLMRPDSQLYMVPADGGKARRMRCNTPLMNSWHSFSPNGRWLVFSSKSRSPYTQMFLTHLDEQGNDSPAVLIDNATAANRAVNIPEFVNIPPDGLLKIDAPAAEFYRVFDVAADLAGKGQYQAAIGEWKKALELDPEDAQAHRNLGVALAETGSLDEALTHYQKAVDLKPEYAKGHNNLASALRQKGRLDEAAAHLEKALEIDPGYDEAHNNLGQVLAESGKLDEAILHWKKAIEINPEYAEAHNNLGRALAEKEQLDEAAAHLQKALELNPKYADALTNLGVVLAAKGKLDEAVADWQKALEINPDSGQAQCNLGNALFEQGRIPEALARWRKGLSLEPNALPVLNQAAWVLATNPEASIRNGAEAVQFAERAVRLSGGQEPAILGTLAAAYAEASRFPDAVQTARRGFAVATQKGDQNLAEGMKAMISLFEAGTPFRESQRR